MDGRELRRARALLDAARSVSAGAGRDLDAVLDALSEQASKLLEADDATVSLIGSDGRLTLRRASKLAAPDSPMSQPGSPALIDGVAEEALAGRYAVFVADLKSDPRVGPEVRTALSRVASCLLAPLIADDRPVGLLAIRWTRPHAPDPDEVAAAEALAGHAAAAVVTARLLEQERMARAAADGLAEAARLVASGTDLDATLDALIEQTRRLLGADDAVVTIADRSTGQFMRRRPSQLVDATSPFGRPGVPAVVTGLTPEAVATRRAVRVPDFHADLRITDATKAAFPTITTALVVPLVADDEVVGMLVVRWVPRRDLDDRLVGLAEGLARHAALAVRAARLLESERRARTIAEELAAAAGRVAAEADLGAALDALAAQVTRLLGADAAAVYLAEGDELIVRRPSPLAEPGTPYATPGARVRPGPFTSAAIRSRAPALSADYQADERATANGQSAFPWARASMALPLHAGEELVGVLRVDWAQPREIGDVMVATGQAFARQAALAVRAARLLDAERRAAAELAAVLDAAGDSVLVYGVDGRLLRANRRARERLSSSIGGVPATLAEFRERAMPRRADGEPLTQEHVDRALRGEVAEAELTLAGPRGTTRRIHVSFGPVLEDGEVRAVVIASRDITLLHDAIAGRARFEGAVAAARTVAHELNNRLQKLSSYAELLPGMDPVESAAVLEEMVEDVASMGATINQLQRIVRFEGTDTPVGTALDIEAATRPAG